MSESIEIKLEKQFDEWWSETYIRSFGSMPNAIMLSYREVALQAWMEANRSKKNVSLPEPFWAENIGDSVYKTDDTHAILTAAGIKYTIGE